MTEPKELAIGEIAEIDGVKVKCVEMTDVSSCKNCHFNDDPIDSCKTKKCIPSERSDAKWAYFEEVADA